MSLFRYKVVLADGKEKTSKITAKTKEAAQIRISELNPVKRFVWIKEEEPSAPVDQAAKPPAPGKQKPPLAPPARKVSAAPKLPAPAKVVAPAKPVSAKTNSKLDKLLFRQDGECFFCGKPLTKASASIEHLLPKSAGGKNDDGNVVACCVTLNRTLGNMSLKEKVQMVLKKSGHFTCPDA